MIWLTKYETPIDQSFYRKWHLGTENSETLVLSYSSSPAVVVAVVVAVAAEAEPLLPQHRSDRTRGRSSSS